MNYQKQIFFHYKTHGKRNDQTSTQETERKHKQKLYTATGAGGIIMKDDDQHDNSRFENQLNKKLSINYNTLSHLLNDIFFSTNGTLCCV